MTMANMRETSFYSGCIDIMFLSAFDWNSGHKDRIPNGNGFKK